MNWLIWNLPGFVHDVILKLTGRRLVLTSEEKEFVSLKWVKKYPLRG